MNQGAGRITRLLAVFGTLAILASLLLTAGSSVGAQDIESLRQRAVELANKLSELEEEASVADEEYLTTLDSLEKLHGEISTTKAAVSEAQGKVAAAEDEASAFLITSYMEAGSTQAVAALGTSDLNDSLNQKMLLDTLRGDREQLADDLTASRADLADRQADLVTKQDQLTEVEADQKAAKARVQAAVDEQQSLYSAANAELKDALAAEQRRREAEAAAAAKAAAAKAAAAKAAAAKAAAPEQPTTSGSNTSTTQPAGGGSPTSSAAPAPSAEPAPRAASAPTAAPAPKAPSAPARPPAPVSPPASGAGGAIAAAQSQLGNPYKWAGSSPGSGFDCSGLTSWAWAQAGKYLPHSSRAQYSATQRVSVANLQPGDLVFFGSPIHHVGLYVGGGSMIHSPRTGDVVKYSSIHYMRNIVGGGRVG